MMATITTTMVGTTTNRRKKEHRSGAEAETVGTGASDLRPCDVFGTRLRSLVMTMRLVTGVTGAVLLAGARLNGRVIALRRRRRNNPLAPASSSTEWPGRGVRHQVRSVAFVKASSCATSWRSHARRMRGIDPGPERPTRAGKHSGRGLFVPAKRCEGKNGRYWARISDPSLSSWC